MTKDMKVIFEVEKYSSYKIKERNVSRETEHTFWDEKGNPTRKNTMYCSHFNTRDEAVEFGFIKLRERVNKAERHLETVTQDLAVYKETYM